MPEITPELHKSEEVYKNHVIGEYGELMTRFRVPGGWIYTHAIMRFGWFDKNWIADTFVPDSPKN